MSTSSIHSSPRYVKIAVDIAHRIYREELKKGCKLRGRSTLAGEYNVSPETIRKSVSLLQNMNVVEVREKSGVYVISKENAKQFIDKYTATDVLNELLSNIKNLRAEKKDIEKKIDENIELLLQHSVYFNNSETTSHYEESVGSNSHLIGKSITEVQFWQNTGATIVAIIRNSKTILSPGPYFQFEKGDVVCFVSREENILKAKDYINSDS